MKPYGFIHVLNGRSLSMIVDVCKCGCPHDSHTYIDFFCFRFLLSGRCYVCNCKKYQFKTKMRLIDAVDSIDIRNGVSSE